MIVYQQIPTGFRMQKIKLTREGSERKKRLESENKCLACEVPFEPGDHIVRGVHQLCDAAQRYAIRSGKETDESLVKRGERAVKKTPGRKPANAYNAKLLGRAGEVSKPTCEGC